MWKFACRNLLSRPARSTLSLVGLTVAIAGMVALFAVKEGLEQSVVETFQQVPGLTVMETGAPVPLLSKVPVAWGEEMRQIDGVGVVNAAIIQRANLIDGEPTISPPVILIGLDIPTRLQLNRDVFQKSITQGRFLETSDRGTGNIVVSQQFATRWKKTVGDSLKISDFPAKVVGIFHTGMVLLDVNLLIDIDTARQMTQFHPKFVSSFYIEQSENDLNSDELKERDEQLKKRIVEHFRGRTFEDGIGAMPMPPNVFANGLSLVETIVWMANHFQGNSAPSIKKSDVPQKTGTQKTNTASKTEESKTKSTAASTKNIRPIEVHAANDWRDKLDDFSNDLDLFLLIMTSIGLSIAVLSIINTMLMSVTERIIEFGVLKANGWSSGDVMRLITYESTAIGFVGGIFGAASGWGVSQLANATWPDRVHLFASPQLLLFSIAFSTVIGIFGGLYPAIWAMRMQPMDAIRRG